MIGMSTLRFGARFNTAIPGQLLLKVSQALSTITTPQKVLSLGKEISSQD